MTSGGCAMHDSWNGDNRHPRRTRDRKHSRASSRASLPWEAPWLLLCASLALLPGCATTHSAAMRAGGGCLEATHAPWPATGDSAAAAGELPKARKSPRGEYPLAAKEMGVHGTVMVSALVCEHGRVVRTRVKDSVPGLDEAAVEAVKHWEFKPARADGKPVSRWVDVAVKY